MIVKNKKIKLEFFDTFRQQSLLFFLCLNLDEMQCILHIILLAFLILFHVFLTFLMFPYILYIMLLPKGKRVLFEFFKPLCLISCRPVSIFSIFVCGVLFELCYSVTWFETMCVFTGNLFKSKVSACIVLVCDHIISI